MMSDFATRLQHFMEVTGATEEEAWNFVRSDAEGQSEDIQSCINRYLDAQTNVPSPYVPPPILPREDVLVAGDISTPSLPNAAIVDRMRNFQVEGELQENLIGIGGDAPHGTASEPAPDVAPVTQGNHFEDLFRPPLDLLFSGVVSQGRDHGMATRKWLLVNLMNREVFNSLILNRDVWPNPAVRALIQDNFVFMQYDHSCTAGMHFATLYNVTEDQSPHINLIDPRTGESLHRWGDDGQPIDVLAFTAYLRAFLELNGPVEGYLSPKDVPERLFKRYLEIEGEMQSAIQASLAHTSSHSLPLL